MKNIKTLILLSLALLLLPIVCAQEKMPVYIDEAKIDGTEIAPEGWTDLNIERGSEFELKLYIQTGIDAEDVEIDAFVSGYEYNAKGKIAGHIGPFDAEKGVTYVKRMKISLPDDLELDKYSVRVFITDRNSNERVYTYYINVDAPRHELKLKDVLLNPNYGVMAGAGFVTKVRLENTGLKDEDDVKVIVGIPELNVQSSEYIDEIENGDEKESEEIFLRLPRCAEAGEYIVAIEVLYNNGHDKITAFIKLNVEENPKCKKEETQQIQIIVPQEQQQQAAEVQEGTTEETVQEKAPKKSMRTILEIALIILVALLIIVGFAIGFSRWRQEE